TRLIAAALLAGTASSVQGQDATIVYRLGRDTVAIEQFTRTPGDMTGETVTRSGPAVIRVAYHMSLDRNGWPATAVIRRRQADGSPIPNSPMEVRFTFRADA